MGATERKDVEADMYIKGGFDDAGTSVLLTTFSRRWSSEVISTKNHDGGIVDIAQSIMGNTNPDNRGHVNVENHVDRMGWSDYFVCPESFIRRVESYIRSRSISLYLRLYILADPGVDIPIQIR